MRQRPFKLYPAYKDSGVEWLGQIPAHWDVKRIRDLADSLQTGPFGSQLHAHEYVSGGIPVINPANLRDGQLVPDSDCAVDDASAARLAHHRLVADDILFARRGEMGRCGMATQQQAGWLCGTGCLRLRTRVELVRPRFVLHLLSTGGVRDWLQLQSVGSTMENLNTSIISRIPVALPDPGEQGAVVAFLDRETARIDALVAKKERLIELLQEKRSALITRAVTKGLDSNVSMKDSGVEWLGGIPAHWEMRPISQILSRITYGFTNPMPVADVGPYMLTAFDIGDGEILYENARRTTEEAFTRLLTDKSRPKAGDILVTKDGTLGRVAVAGGERTCINQSVALLRFDPSLVDIDFVHNVLRAAPYQDRMIFEAGGTAIKHIYVSRLAKMSVALPPVHEQSRIRVFVSGQRGGIDSLLGKVREAVTRLRELRTALISAAVTGKIDVRAASADASAGDGEGT